MNGNIANNIIHFLEMLIQRADDHAGPICHQKIRSELSHPSNKPPYLTYSWVLFRFLLHTIQIKKMSNTEYMQSGSVAVH